jgi:hypothetical protein
MNSTKVYFRLRCGEATAALLGAVRVPPNDDGTPGLVRAAKRQRSAGVIIINTASGANYLWPTEIVDDGPA